MFENSNAIVRNVHSQVADRIGISIVRGDIGVGDALPSEMQICEMIDVSRTVVREAIRTLTGKGLVESRAKSGTRVRPPRAMESARSRRAALAARNLRCRQLPRQAVPAALRGRAGGGGAGGDRAPAKKIIARIRAGLRRHGGGQGQRSLRRRRHRLPPGDLFCHPQRVLLADRADVRDHAAPELSPSPPAATTARARWSSTAPCWTPSRRAMPKARARRPTSCLNHSADDLVKIRGREFAQRGRRRDRRRADRPAPIAAIASSTG